MNYIPKPIDTSHVTLPTELVALAERLAENAHELWSAQRLRDGWTWGSQRDDAQKKKRWLVHYHELPESEKEYGRIATSGLVKAVTALGYRIEAPTKKTLSDA